MNEILSPAGTIEAFYAAISNGCDAIYLGIDKFNARAYANNFSIDNLKELVRFAHLREVKIYVTMNTILYDEELQEAFDMVDQLAKIHVDALIIQDLALLNYVTSRYKSLQAHASTQMGIDDINGAALLKELGVTRVVFARETPLNVLKDVKEKLGIEIETFIHGALCVCYSGNCLMSSMIGDRSGNRGRCAGCCRQKYALINVSTSQTIKTGFLLSMKDLNVSDFIPQMDFVDSLKIEGRMKEPTYVGGVTRYYRELIDNQNPDKACLDKVFNRTYTKGFMNNESCEDITNIERPNNFGYLIGKVSKINKDTIWIKLFKKLNKGDQIRIEAPNYFDEISIPVTKLFDANFKECESNSKVAILSCHKKVELGAKVYKTKDIEFNKTIEDSFRHKEYKKLPINFIFSGKIGEKMSLKAIYKQYSAIETLDFVVEKSIKSVTTYENIFKQLNKLNETPYQLADLKVEMDKDSFIPLKLLNELRRGVIEKLDNLRTEQEIILNHKDDIKVHSYQLHDPEICVQVSNYEQYEAARELGINHIYFKNIVRRNNAKYIKEEDEILIGGLGSIYKYRNTKSLLIGDYSLNASNYQAVAVLNYLGVNRITLSCEMNKDHINKLVEDYFNQFNTYPNLELIVYGRSFLMHSKYCPLKRLGLCGECKKSKFVLKDRFEEFPLMFNDDCTTNILNAKTLNLMDDIDKIHGVNYFRLVFTTENKQETKRVISEFKSILNGNKLKTFNNQTQTRGHFIKNPL